ncbi:hypothetical protein ASE08_18755 [Rhizobacter sp. Root16D2]|nr:hypothetical protein ASC88_05925 [Rhizobacter sp. Root29]KQV97022.1 hypothetical protein ASC98_12855 [Rhizobacter sp. Root1238]KRB24094.1 hypothetical protein ASE08_18755 [Rhizobacter sp. Root16D2]
MLLLAPFLYGEGSANGGAALCWAQLKELAGVATVAFLGYRGAEPDDTDRRALASLQAHCAQVDSVPLQIARSAVLRARLGSFAFGEPELARLCRTPAMDTALRAMLERFRPDIVWIQFPQMAQYVALCDGIPCVMDVQDAYSLSGFRQAQRAPGPRNWLNWVAWARYEARHYPRFAAALTLSEQDAQVLQALNPATRALSMGLPLADDQVLQRAHGAAVAGRVGFAGSFGHQPNLEGMAWFLRDIWPRVRERMPQARFVVAGRNPPAALVAQADGGSGIEFSGFVPDIHAFYASNAVTVVPLVSGGGVKIKTVEAMLAGSAVVSTRIGVEGTGALDGCHAMVADEAQAFADHTVRVLSDDALRARLSEAARQHAGVAFSARSWRERVMATVNEAAGGASAGPLPSRPALPSREWPAYSPAEGSS